MTPATKCRVAPTDAELFSAISAGKLEALGALFDRYEPDVRRYLGRLGVSRSDADDLVQATFLQVIRAAARFDPAFTGKGFLFGIATMVTRRHRRSLGRALARLAPWSGLFARPDQPTPADVVEHDETSRALARAIDRLPAKKRDVFVMVALEGLSGETAARALGVPINTVWTRLHHARKELRAALLATERTRDREGAP